MISTMSIPLILLHSVAINLKNKQYKAEVNRLNRYKIWRNDEIGKRFSNEEQFSLCKKLAQNMYLICHKKGRYYVPHKFSHVIQFWPYHEKQIVDAQQWYHYKDGFYYPSMFVAIYVISSEQKHSILCHKICVHYFAH